MLCLNFDFIPVFEFLFKVLKFDFYFLNPYLGFTSQTSISENTALNIRVRKHQFPSCPCI